MRYNILILKEIIDFLSDKNMEITGGGLVAASFKMLNLMLLLE